MVGSINSYTCKLFKVVDRFYEAKKRFFEGLARFPREKEPHKYYSLVYPQGGWKILEVGGIRMGSKRKKRLVVLRLSNLGIFKVIVHRDFPIDSVGRVVKLAKSESIYLIHS